MRSRNARDDAGKANRLLIATAFLLGRLRIRAKLYLAFSAISLLVIASAITATIWLSNSDAKVLRILSLAEFADRQSTLVELNLMTMSDAMRGYLLDPSNEVEYQRKLASDAELSQVVEQLRVTLAEMPGVLRRIVDLEKYDDQVLNKAEDRLLAMTKADVVAAKRFYDTDYLLLRERETKLILALRQEIAQVKEAVKAEAAATHAEQLVLGFSATAAVLILSGALAWLCGRLIADQIRAMTTAMGRLAAGDTTTEIPAQDSRDEVGDMAKAVDVFKGNMIKADHLAAATRQIQERLALATESARIGIWDFDVAAGKLLWDARMYELYGIRAQDVSGAYDAWQAGLYPDDRARGDIAIAAAIDGTKDFNIEFRVLWPNGEVRHIEAHALVQRAADGRALRMIGVNWDITERKLREQQIAWMARYDALTGLANRHVFVEILEQTIARAHRTGTSFAVLYLDLDHFKDVNDAFGHPVGDILLKTVARRLQANIREVDLAARFGGDEFAVILQDIAEPANAALVSERILAAIGDKTALQAEVAAVAAGVAEEIVKAVAEPVTIEANRINSSVSVGIVVYGSEAPDAETVLSYADMALYRAKAERRGSYQFFTDGMDADVRARVSMSTELRDAIASEQFFLMYQPQVDIDTGRIVGLEALVRWQHPTAGILGPGRFLPEAERNGLIVPLGRWVIHEACRQTRLWLDAGIAPPLVAVNLSAIQFKMPLELECDIAAAMRDAGLPSQILELELTESVLMAASHDHNDVILRLRKGGHRIAIDDFGSGYSSLEYLRRYPVDRIKIAQTFIADIGIETGSGAIVRAALGLARELNVEVVVEGVETIEQLALLKAWGSRIAQGYYFARPLAVPEVTALLCDGKITPA